MDEETENEKSTQFYPVEIETQVRQARPQSKRSLGLPAAAIRIDISADDPSDGILSTGGYSILSFILLMEE